MIHDVCKDIIFNLKINKFIETGTYVGETVVKVSEWIQEWDPKFGIISGKKRHQYLQSFFLKRKIYYPEFKRNKNHSKIKIYSVDINQARQKALTKIFKTNNNIKIINSSSDIFLKKIISKREIKKLDNCLFYLDAHWGPTSYWPLRDEIKEVLKLKRSIIVIDDFAVPFHPQMGFDVFDYKVCDWFYIKDLFRKCKFKVYYPKKSNIDNRGTVFIFIGYKNKELEFMKKLPCFSPILKGDPIINLLGKTKFSTTAMIKAVLMRMGLLSKVRTILSSNN